MKKPTPPRTARQPMHVAVVGAGMAGVAAARTLLQAGHRVTLIEKSRGFGGRMATRRTEFGGFDHGAQYFTVRDKRFETALRSNATSVVRPWSASTVRVLDEFGHVLASAPGRWALAGLATDWADAPVADVRAALLDMRHSRLALRQQAYLALRELNAESHRPPKERCILYITN